MVDKHFFLIINKELQKNRVTLVAVSKKKSIAAILELYELGQRDFGENYVQELVEKQQQLPSDIRWHFIGHLQTNKIKQIISFVHLIHGVDSIKLLNAVNKYAQQINRVVNCLLQIHIAQEETKFGLDEVELAEIQQNKLDSVQIEGLMGMASFTTDQERIRIEFQKLKRIYDKIENAKVLSMGMSADYKIAIEEGSNMVRIGSLIFGERN